MELSIIDRVVGLYPVSIGTSLAIEGLTHTGEHEEDNGEPPVRECEVLYINLRTLFRNAFGSYEDLKDRLRLEIMRETILADISGIKEAVSAASPNTVCVVYLCNYKSVNKEFKEAKFKNPNTDNQVFYSSLEFDVYNEAEETYDGIEIFDVELKGEKDTFVLTHMPIDLLSHKNFPSLKLLESHTGKVKNRMMWYTKLNGKDPHIPFNRATLQIFGDGITFSPQDLKVRRVLQKVAKEKRWTQNTSDEMINLSLRNANEPFVLDFYRRMKKS